MKRRGFTLIELIVAAALVALVVTLVVLELQTGAAEATHHETRHDLAAAATVLQGTLSQDLRRCLPLGVLDPADRVRGEARGELVVPLQAAYQGDATKALRYRRLRYSWTGGSLSRAGRPLPLPGLAAVRFTWSDEVPTRLAVELTGVARGIGETPRLRFEVMAPAGTDSPEGWTPAPHHRGGQLVD